MKTLDDLQLPDSKGTEKKLSKKARIRVLKVVDLIRKGYSRTRIIEELQNTESLSGFQAARYYECAVDYLTPDEDEQHELRISIISTLQELIVDNCDKATTIRALDLLAKISGNMTQKVDINSDIKINFNIDTEPDEEDEQGN